ncbi:MAG TPA: hypothetical protein VN661_12290 [Candidatus Acidoferrales bacterium]|nr:hypothetical protein [Candidatus Acidoferrales bacterium]
MRRQSLVLPLALATLFSAPAFACDYPLSSIAIREAYFLGKDNTQKTADFLAQYTRAFPLPKSGPYTATIEFDTPYAAVVERARNAVNYYSPDAVQEFLDKPGIFHARVEIYLANPYSTRIRPSDFWRDFTITLSQEATVEPTRVEGEPLYGRWGELLGATIDLTFAPEKIASAPATVTVVTPEGKKTAATFDLARLK